MSGYSARKSSASSSQQTIDKRIAQIGIQIAESKSKIDEYISLVNSKLEETINAKITHVVNQHSSILEEKDGRIQELIRDITQFKEIDRLESEEQFKKALQECRDSMHRMSAVLQIFRKESDKYRMELDIKEKELQCCREREKKLIKKVWILEENIKDIYSYDIQALPELPGPLRTKKHPEINSHRYLVNASQQVKSQQNTSKTLYTEQVSQRQRTEFKMVKEEPPRTPKPTIYDKTKLSQQLNRASNKKVMQRSSLSYSRENHGVNRQQAPALLKQKNQRYSVYDDLRHSLRKVSRLESSCPRYLEQEDRLIGIEQFRLIAVNGPKVLQQVQKIVIEQHGYLKQIDSESIALLNLLFSSINATKILEIILFNYSVEALREIKRHKEQIRKDNFYSQPTVEGDQECKPAKVARVNKHKLDLAIRKNFKNVFQTKKTAKVYINVDVNS